MVALFAVGAIRARVDILYLASRKPDIPSAPLGSLTPKLSHGLSQRTSKAASRNPESDIGDTLVCEGSKTLPV